MAIGGAPWHLIVVLDRGGLAYLGERLVVVVGLHELGLE